MLNFKNFITEAEETVKPTKLGHLTHAHRMMFVFPKQGKDENGNPIPLSDEEKSMGGHSGIGTTDEHLNYLHDYLRGAKLPASVNVGEKMEGAPSFLIRKTKRYSSEIVLAVWFLASLTSLNLGCRYLLNL